MNSVAFEEITGLPPPDTPADPWLYARHGYLFYELWGEESKKAVAGSFSGVKSDGEIDGEVDAPLNIQSTVVFGGPPNHESSNGEPQVRFFTTSELLPRFQSAQDWGRHFA